MLNIGFFKYLNIFLKNIFIIICFLIFFFISDFIYFHLTREIFLNYGIDANLFYLPHGVRTLGALSFGFNVLPGLLIAQTMSGYIYTCQSGQEIYQFIIVCDIEFSNHIKIIFGGLLTIASVYISYFLLKLNRIKDFNKITIFQILNFVFVSAIINALVINIFFMSIFDKWELSLNLALYTIGDIVGAMMLFVIIKIVFKFYNLIRL